MDYTRFRFEAVVDWTEIEIQTARTTNFPAIQRKLNRILRLPQGKNVHVRAMDEGAGTDATIFRLQIQDPKNGQHVTEILRKLAKDEPFTRRRLRTAAIEVAFDAYSRDEATIDELAELGTHFYLGMTRPVSENRRLYHAHKGSPKSIDTPEKLIRNLKDGWQIAIGDKEDKKDKEGIVIKKADDLYQHAYLKTTDNGKALPVSEYRMRLEIRLQGSELDNFKLTDWENCSFKRLSNFFNFRQWEEKVELDPLRQLISEKCSRLQFGERGKSKLALVNRLYPISASADTELNRKASDALRNLSKRWNRNEDILCLLHT